MLKVRVSESALDREMNKIPTEERHSHEFSIRESLFEHTFVVINLFVIGK